MFKGIGYISIIGQCQEIEKEKASINKQTYKETKENNSTKLNQENGQSKYK